MPTTISYAPPAATAASSQAASERQFRPPGASIPAANARGSSPMERSCPATWVAALPLASPTATPQTAAAP